MSTRHRSKSLSAVQIEWPHMASAVFLLSIMIPLAGFLLLARIPLFLPSMSLIALASSAVVALAAWCSSSDRHGHGITLWDVSGAFAFLGFAAGMLSDPQQVLEF
jgi:hypothetical protein